MKKLLIILFVFLCGFGFSQNAEMKLNVVTISALDTDFKIALPAYSLVYVQSNNTLYKVAGYYDTSKDMNDAIADGNAVALGAGGFADPMTTAGDIIYYGAAGTTRLAAGTENYVLKMGATYPEWAAESGGGDTSFFDLSGTTIITKAGASNLTVGDTIRADVALLNQIGTGTYDVNINGELYADSAYIDSLFVNADLRGGAYFLVADGSGDVVTLLDTTGAFTQGSGGGTSYWELDGLSLINDTANSDTVRVPDGILGLGALNVNSGKILFHSSVDVGYDFNVYNSYGRLSTNSATFAIAGNRGIYNGSTGDAIFRPNYTENTGIGSDSQYETTVVVDGHEVLTADTLGVTITDILRIPPRAAAPASPSEGWIYSNSTDHHLYYYNGSTWVQLD